MSGDSLRNTLDHLALDPNSGNDRYYLITVLRRLGYSDKEIQRVLGDEGEESRVIEVEYTGGAPGFTFGQEGSEEAAAAAIASGQGGLTFTMAGDDGEAMQFKLAEDETAGTETFDAVELGDGDIGDDWADDWGEGDFSDEFTDGSAATDDWGEGDGEEGELVQFGEKPLVQFREKRMNLVPFTAEGDEDPISAAGWVEVGTYEVEAPPGGVWEPTDTDADLEWESADDAWAEADAGDDQWDAVEGEADDTPFVHEGFTLYARQVDLATGKSQQIYFFAKETPSSGVASPLPEGYEVAISEKTGLPFLRKSDGTMDEQAAVAEAPPMDAGGAAWEPVPEDTWAPVAETTTPDDSWASEPETSPTGAETPWPDHDNPKLQCGALTADNKQCRLTAQAGGQFCHVHNNYVPPTKEEMSERLDTAPAFDVDDTAPGEATGGSHQCAAITAEGMQCRNTSRSFSLYCASHKGYHPTTPMEVTDTAPVGRGVEDTLPVTAEDSDETTFAMDAPPARQTRTRVKRVAADSPEEAEAAIAREGGKVRSVVPVRIEDHDD